MPYTKINVPPAFRAQFMARRAREPTYLNYARRKAQCNHLVKLSQAQRPIPSRADHFLTNWAPAQRVGLHCIPTSHSAGQADFWEPREFVSALTARAAALDRRIYGCGLGSAVAMCSGLLLLAVDLATVGWGGAVLLAPFGGLFVAGMAAGCLAVALLEKSHHVEAERDAVMMRAEDTAREMNALAAAKAAWHNRKVSLIVGWYGLTGSVAPSRVH